MLWPDLCDHAFVRSRVHAVVLPAEVGDFSAEVRDVFMELGRTFAAGSLAGECSPPIDVFETDEAVELAVDLPGVDQTAVRVLIKREEVLIVGEKVARVARGAVRAAGAHLAHLSNAPLRPAQARR